MTRARIWYVSKYAAPPKYGFGTRHFHLARAWVSRGHHVVVFSSNSSHLTDRLPRFRGGVWTEDIAGVTAAWLKGRQYRTSSGLNRVLSWLEFEVRLLLMGKRRFGDPDVVIVSSLSLLTVLTGAWLAQKHSARLVFEVRDIWPLSAIELSGMSRRNPMVRILAWIERFGYARADRIVGTMPNLVEHVMEVAPGNAHKVRCVPQGFWPDAPDMAPERLPGPTAAQIESTKGLRVGYAGRMNVNNPLDSLIEAARRLRDEEVEFFLLGGGTERAKLEYATRDLPNVRFFDPVPRNQVGHFLSLMDVCFDSFSSRLGRFGLSRNKWIDYMLAAKPIVCAFDGYRSMINEAQAGVFTPFDDPAALAGTFLSFRDAPKDELRAMGERGRRYVLEHRNFQRLGDDYMALILDITRDGSAEARAACALSSNSSNPRKT